MDSVVDPFDVLLLYWDSQKRNYTRYFWGWITENIFIFVIGVNIHVSICISILRLYVCTYDTLS